MYLILNLYQITYENLYNVINISSHQKYCKRKNCGYEHDCYLSETCDEDGMCDVEQCDRENGKFHRTIRKKIYDSEIHKTTIFIIT